MEGNKVQNYKSCFDIIGPIMVGPSSSHTAGAIAIGALARQLFGGTPKNVRCDYYESFSETHKGHGTDFAIISGILGFATDDERVPRAVEIAVSQGMHIEFVERKEPSPVNHANTADLTLSDEKRTIRLILGESYVSHRSRSNPQYWRDSQGLVLFARQIQYASLGIQQSQRHAARARHLSQSLKFR